MHVLLTTEKKIMKIFPKAKLKKSDNETNIDKYRVAANITEYHLYIKISLPKSHHSKIMFKWKDGRFGQSYRVAALSTFYLTVTGIILPSLISIVRFKNA